MSIEKKCENCSLDGHCLYQSIETNCIDGVFIPKEELVRQDEREQIIDFIKSNPLVIFDGKDSYICIKAVEAYREKLLYRLNKIKIKEQ